MKSQEQGHSAFDGVSDDDLITQFVEHEWQLERLSLQSTAVYGNRKVVREELERRGFTVEAASDFGPLRRGVRVTRSVVVFEVDVEEYPVGPSKPPPEVQGA